MNAGQRRRAKIAIIGDRFMTPSTFEAAIRARCDVLLDIETIELPWPDEPMRTADAEPGMDGLKAYEGDAEAIGALCRLGRDRDHPARAVLCSVYVERMPVLQADRCRARRSGSISIMSPPSRTRRSLIVNAPLGATPRRSLSPLSARSSPRIRRMTRWTRRAASWRNGVATLIDPTSSAGNYRRWTVWAIG